MGVPTPPTEDVLIFGTSLAALLNGRLYQEPAASPARLSIPGNIISNNTQMSFAAPPSCPLLETSGTLLPVSMKLITIVKNYFYDHHLRET
jgi:hypothetical protein